MAVSIETTTASAVARSAERAAREHKRDCIACSRRLSCRAGRQLARDAAQARALYRESKAADQGPGPNDAALFDPAELGVPVWRYLLECHHETIAQSGEWKPGDKLSCLQCQGQKRIIDVIAGQGNGGNDAK